MASPRRTAHLALYGNASLERVYCYPCAGWTLVRSGTRLCCDRHEHRQPVAAIRMSQPEFRRRLPPKWIRDEILAEQGDACLYCERTFDGFEVKLQWDHLLPWSHTMNNRDHNFAAACHECNQAKSNLIFATVDDARAYIAQRNGVACDDSGI